MNTQHAPQYLVDQELARRLERAEGRANAEFVDARAKVRPELGACWIEVAGTLAMYDGVDSPCTQTFGLGMFEPVGNREMETLEAFFHERSAEVHHEVSPLADSSLLALLNGRGYQPFELSTVLFRPIESGLELAPPRDQSIRVRLSQTGEESLWAQTAARGWLDVAPEYFDYITELGPVNAERTNTRCFFAEYDGQPIAAGAVGLFEGVALLAGACTIPEWRNRGAQRALLQARLRHGAEQGCDLAMMVAAPGSASQRNAERQGFRIGYTRMKWRLARPVH
ncbi:MAG: GNAT family N-acetyltransferase [Pirellulales bacterium]